MPARPLQQCLVPGCGLRTFEPFCHAHWYAIAAPTRSEIYRLRAALKRVPVGGWYGRRAEMRRAKLGDLLRQAYRRALQDIRAAVPQSSSSADAPGLGTAGAQTAAAASPGISTAKVDRAAAAAEQDVTGLEF